MKLSRLGLACLMAGAAALAACSPPKYVHYWSVWRDWHANVPWGWNIRTEQENGSFARTDLNGPFAPEFFLGVPTISVRWHQYRSPHRLPDGLAEYYKDADDYIKQTLSTVYGPHCADFWDEKTPPTKAPEGSVVDDKGLGQPCGLVEKKDGKLLVKGHPDLIYIGDGNKAKHFTVMSPVVVPEDYGYGTSYDPQTKQRFVVRMHEYAVLPMSKGFYVLVYPATREGYDLFRPQFNEFINSFKVYKEGPASTAAAAPVAASKPAK